MQQQVWLQYVLCTVRMKLVTFVLSKAYFHVILKNTASILNYLVIWKATM